VRFLEESLTSPLVDDFVTFAGQSVRSRLIDIIGFIDTRTGQRRLEVDGSCPPGRSHYWGIGPESS